MKWIGTGLGYSLAKESDGIIELFIRLLDLIIDIFATLAEGFFKLMSIIGGALPENFVTGLLYFIGISLVFKISDTLGSLLSLLFIYWLLT